MLLRRIQKTRGPVKAKLAYGDLRCEWHERGEGGGKGGREGEGEERKQTFEILNLF